MKIMITFLSAIIVFLGIIPFLGENFPIPNKGYGYSIILVGLGILIIIASVINNLLMGFEKFVLILQGILIGGIALLPFLPTILIFLPREGPLYAVMIIIVGVLGLIYGVLGMG